MIRVHDLDKRSPCMSTTALILAAGRARRFGASRPKQYSSLAGKPMLRHSLEAFAVHPAVTDQRVVIHLDDLKLYEQASVGLDLGEPIIGGEDRQESARRALERLIEAPPERVLIHDAARPCVTPALIDRVIEALASAPGAIPALPLADTLKRVSDGRVATTVPRTDLWRAQTPQGFRFSAILDAHLAAADTGFTDDASLAEAAGLVIAVVSGEEDNLKVTTTEDLARAARILERPPEIRVGSGFDVHRFGPGAGLRLCGVDIPHDRRLIGHSDADVGLHALTDAILGALGAGDIGEHFPPDDLQWSGVASDRFLSEAVALVRAGGGHIVHVDLTLICEAPRLASHRAAMVQRIAAILVIETNRVSVKATTTERLGFTGRGEGIAAQAVATLRLPQPTSRGPA